MHVPFERHKLWLLNIKHLLILWPLVSKIRFWCNVSHSPKYHQKTCTSGCKGYCPFSLSVFVYKWTNQGRETNQAQPTPGLALPGAPTTKTDHISYTNADTPHPSSQPTWHEQYCYRRASQWAGRSAFVAAPSPIWFQENSSQYWQIIDFTASPRAGTES